MRPKNLLRLKMTNLPSLKCFCSFLGIKSLLCLAEVAFFFVALSSYPLKAQELVTTQEQVKLQEKPTPQEVLSKAKLLICRKGGIARTVEVEKPAEGGCRTRYTKDGSAKIVGSGIYPETCQRHLTNIKGNLEKSGWRCREYDKYEVIDSKES